LESKQKEDATKYEIDQFYEKNEGHQRKLPVSEKSEKDVVKTKIKNDFLKISDFEK
jgi:hypothetical protein